jgi:sodium transport system permease protein
MSSPAVAPMGFRDQVGRVARMARKELRECLRDRRTILTLVLMPLLLYPVLGVAFKQFFLSNLAAGVSPVYRIGFESLRDQQVFLDFLAPERRRPNADDADEPTLDYRIYGDLAEAVRSSAANLGIRLRPPAEGEPGRDGEWDFELLYREDSVLGMNALAALENRITEANTRLLEWRLRKLGLKMRAVPVQTHRAPVTDTGAKTTISLSALVPLVLILMTITGAVYPAIDLTAGERERGTLEILVAAPIPRLGLLFAKYVAVVCVALLTALVNLTAMTLTIWISGLGPTFFGAGGLSLVSVVQVFGLLVLFAAFFSALLLILTSFARSFKEAQAYLVPLILLSLLPGMLALVPEMTLSPVLAVAPLINIILLARDLLDGQAEPLTAVAVVASTIVYGMAAIALAAMVFGAEAVLYGEQGLFSRSRRSKAESLEAP